MIGGIVAVPERRDHVEKLVQRLYGSDQGRCREISVFYDYNYEGTWWNQTRAFELLKKAKHSQIEGSKAQSCKDVKS